MSIENADLGFTLEVRANEITIFHHGRRAAVLRGREADRFSAKLEHLSEAELQQLMARLTGNYKRGNERVARRHPRNRT